MAKGITTATADLRKLSLSELQTVIDAATRIMNEKRDARREELMAELQKLGGAPGRRGSKSKVVSDAAPARRKSKKAGLKYRSKKDPQNTWSGRGMLPLWMREEMKGTRLAKEDFLIEGSTAPERNRLSAGVSA